jgi:tetratricopeptide (TPR) repeat protein
MYDFSQDPKNIRTRIRSYERALRREQERFGAIHDGAGKRYLLGPLYVLMGDTEGALRSFAWFAETFPDDSGEPLHLLCWTLALYRAGQTEQAAATLRQTMLSNLYLMPRLLGRDQDIIDMWHPSNRSEKRYVDALPDEWYAVWEPSALAWVRTVYDSEPMRRVRDIYIAIYTALQEEPPGPRRSRLVEEAFQLQYPTLQ